MHPTTNPLLLLQALGQSVWLDYIRRSLLENGELTRLIGEDGVCGVTSNPSIFELAITASDDYHAAITTLAGDAPSSETAYETLVIDDIRAAADLLRSVYLRTDGRDGYVSLEVSPHLAHDTDGTVAAARRLWTRIDRPNCMIKIPATQAGLPAIRRTIAAGINVNVTLVFAVERYSEVAEAFVAGLEDRVAAGQPVDTVASVASVFVSRIDTLVDARLGDAGPECPLAADLHGRAGIAVACLAYRRSCEWTRSARWAAPADRGARPQRLLWASTGTKDAQASDVKYVEALIAPGTINTLPPQTLAAYRDHGQPAARIEAGLAQADATVAGLAACGMELAGIGRMLEAEGVKKFADAYDTLLAKLDVALRKARG
jgi:transaldolase